MRREVNYDLNLSLRIVAIIVLLLPGVSLAASKTAIEWIQTMSEAMRELNYRGNFVYMHDNQLESMSISHMKDESGEKERLLSLNGEAREVIRDNKNLTCIWPSSRKVVVDFSSRNSFSPISIPEDIERISNLYDLKLIGKDRVANHETVVIHIKPRDEYRYGLKFWVNAENGLMMKSNLINSDNKVVEQVMFTSLELLKAEEELDIIEIPPIGDNYTLVRYHSGDSSGSIVSQASWQLGTVPTGFRQQSVLKRLDSASGNTFQQMVFTDGLASLSVFIERQSDRQLPSGASSMGAVNAFIRKMSEFSVTAIGEVPAVTVKQMAESILYQNP